ncbi:MAG: hypothetical protein AB2693_03825 [Candidatus Thiodiazotropha sp.]
MADCTGDGSRSHTFECHLPLVLRGELHGQDITVRRSGGLSMIASWLLGDRASLRSLANYFHLMDLSSTLAQTISPHQQRAMTELRLHLHWDPTWTSRFDFSTAGNEEWVLVHWQVLLRLLAKVQPPARLQPLRELFRLTEEEPSLPRPPLAFDSHCHLDQCRLEFRFPRTASLQQTCAHVRPDVDREVTLEGVVASFCDPDTYPTPEEVRSLTDQGCFVVVSMY